MSYAIIGFGEIGQALARAFARKGIEVSVATTRDPKHFACSWRATTKMLQRKSARSRRILASHRLPTDRSHLRAS
ncbi:NAD(P)-binding domain-containing protein [Glacieibacterium sp.]|uniref:NAD(P)-binding domain-containing protein n=1 Tax=Glacieibacterium sp. TaxID=2860237 RepID=UPI003B008326